MSRAWRPWTQEEVAFLKVNYSTMPTRDLARALGKKYHNVATKANKLGLRKKKQEATAFGETKSVGEWSRDPRAVASYGAILYRLEDGWDAERAITTPQKRYYHDTPRGVKPGDVFGNLVVESIESRKTHPWGVFKCRCGNTVQRQLDYIRGRTNRGFVPDCGCSKSEFNVNDGRRYRLITAFGETKNLAQWTRDPRCSASYITVLSRMDKLRWDVEKAITTPPQIQRR